MWSLEGIGTAESQYTLYNLHGFCEEWMFFLHIIMKYFGIRQS